METLTELTTICAIGLLLSFFIMLVGANLATLARRAMKRDE